MCKSIFSSLSLSLSLFQISPPFYFFFWFFYIFYILFSWFCKLLFLNSKMKICWKHTNIWMHNAHYYPTCFTILYIYIYLYNEYYNILWYIDFSLFFYFSLSLNLIIELSWEKAYIYLCFTTTSSTNTICSQCV